MAKRNSKGQFVQKPLEARFWEKVNKAGPDECWSWNGATSGSGYGHLKMRGRQTGAHRVCWTLHFGRIPVGAQILHICDNKTCVNPAHLEIGTARKNAIDAVRRLGRARGSRNCNNKLSQDEVREIRRLYASGEFSQYQLADRFNVARHTIYTIVKGKTWGWLR